jgi:hypothetical protein
MIQRKSPSGGISMGADPTVAVRLYGALHTLQKKRGESTEVVVEVPVEGIRADALAERLDLPLQLIEGVFSEHRVHGLDLVVRPGDSIAYVPRGTPGPHRFTLGLYHAGKQ